jgi:phenylpropionate dioxygenase-like ring-hydroxylating dioxygenase large terminal subunit
VEREAELSLIRRLLAHLAAGTTDQAPQLLRLPASHHADPTHLDRERRQLFRGQPVAAALAGDLPGPGSFLGLEIAGIPLLLLRGRDGRVRAFANACRHRGAPVAEGAGTASGGRIRCPFHAWTYDLEGALAAIPLGESGYSSCDRTQLGLRPRPCAEANGLILVRPEGDAPIDPGAWLGAVAADLDALDLAHFHPFAARRSTWNANWKLLLETFLESFHVFSLHRETVHPHYYSLPMVADPIGPHLRFPVARRTLDSLREKPESEWRLVSHATVQWYLAPNALLSATRDYALLWRFESPEPNRTLVETRFYTARPVADEAERKRFDDAFDLQLRVTGAEDFPMQEKIQRGLDAGAAGELVIGTHEIGVIHFHATLARLMAQHGDVGGGDR